MVEAICEQCGAVYIVRDKLPSNIECLCKESKFKLVEPVLTKI